MSANLSLQKSRHTEDEFSNLKISILFDANNFPVAAGGRQTGPSISETDDSGHCSKNRKYPESESCAVETPLLRSEENWKTNLR